MRRNSPSLAAALALLGAGVLAGQQQPELVVQSGGGQATAIRFGGQGRWVVTGGADRRLRIYDTQSGRLTRVLTLPDIGMPSYAAPAMAAHPIENLVAAAAAAGQAAAFDIETGAERWRTIAPSNPQGGMTTLTALEYSGDGSQLFGLFMTWAPSPNGEAPRTEALLKTWNAANGSEISSRPVLEGCYPMGFSIDGGWIYGVRSDPPGSQISVIADRATGRPVGSAVNGYVMSAHAGTGRALVMRSNNGPQDATVALVDIRGAKTIGTWPGYGGAFSPGGDRLLVAGIKANWMLVDAQTAKVVLPGDPSLPVGFAWAISADNGLVALAQMDAVAVVPTSAPKEQRILGNQAASLISGETMQAASGEGEKAERVSQEWRAKFGSTTNLTPAAVFTPDGRWLVVRAADGQLDVWDTATGNRMPFRIPSNMDSKEPLFAGEDGRSLWVRSEVKEDVTFSETKIMGEKIQTPTMRQSFTAQRIDIPGARVASEQKLTGAFVCASPDGRYVVEILNATKKKPTVNLRSTADGQVVADMAALGFDPLGGCSISPDGSRMIVGRSADKSKHKISAAVMPMMKSLGAVAMGGVVLEVLDWRANRVIAELQDRSGKRGVFSFGAAGVRWSSNGKYVVAGGKEEGPMGLAPTGVLPDSAIKVWETGTGRQILELPNTVVPLGLTPDGGYLISGISEIGARLQDRGVEIWDLNSAKRVLTLADALASPDTLILSPNGRVIAAPDRDGALSFWEKSSGKLLGQLRAMQEGEWLVTTPSGAFDGSPRGWSQIAWRGSGGRMETASGELFFNEFYRPGLLADLIDGGIPSEAKPIAELDRLQPSIVVSASATGPRSATVRIDITAAPAGVRDLRLFRNGVLVKLWRGDLPLTGGKARLENTVTLTAGTNRLVAYAFNHDNIKSPDASFAIVSTAPLRKGTTYALAIGVNEYANREFNLQYAVPDARALGAELGRTQMALGQSDAVHVVELLNADATRANILFALDRLAGKGEGGLSAGIPPALAELHAAQPEDTVVLYFAGHGLATGDRFYLVPHDLGYAGPRNELRAALGEVLAHSISDRDLERAVEPIDARHLALIIDACQSGQAIQSEEERRGPMNSRGLAQLAYEKGMSILTASQAYQAALESSRLGHGYLTFALVEEGLKTPAADSAPVDGQVTAAEWFQYAAKRVPQLQMEALDQAKQHGRLLTFEPVRNGSNSNRLQTPRFFSKRDAAGPPLIVARPERR